MLQEIKTFLIPGEANGLHPHLLRPSGVIAVLLFLGFVNFLAFGQTGQHLLGFATDINQRDLLEETNQQRAQRNLGGLEYNPKLAQAAEAKARHMLAKNYWAHTGPGGTEPWSFFEQAGYEYRVAGENLAKGFMTTQGAVKGWMKSPSHRDNLLKPEYTEAGFAVVDGNLAGEQTTLVVALYGRPQTSVSIQPARAAGASSTTNIGAEAVNFSVIQPLPLKGTMPLASAITLVILSAVGVIYLTQHVVIKQNHLHWSQQTRLHPLFGAATALVAAVVIINLSLGSVL